MLTELKSEMGIIKDKISYLHEIDNNDVTGDRLPNRIADDDSSLSDAMLYKRSMDVVHRSPRILQESK